LQSRRAAAQSPATFATLREIEGRLKSIRNIEKITNTMKIVASTKLNRAQRAMQESRKYGGTSNEVFESAETKAVEGEDKKKLVIVCSSDKGLCGGIHSGLSRYIRKKSLDEKFDIVILGEKAKAQLQRTHAKNIVLNFAGVGKDIPTFAESQSIADQIVTLPTQYSDVEIVYNKFINATSYEASSIEAFSEEAILASRRFSSARLCSQTAWAHRAILANFSAFEVDEELLANLREYTLANNLFWALSESHACEISARRNAMDVSVFTPLPQSWINHSPLTNQPCSFSFFQNASKNAGEMIGKYQILFNRTRQAVITGELVEIITGAIASEEM
jgi:F-type H+-transporting ATPase subunit gamma